MTINKTLFLFVGGILFSACTTKTEITETPQQKEERRAKEIAAPFIANEIGDFNILVEKVKDTSLDNWQRSLYADKLCKAFVQYMCPAVNSIYSPAKNVKERGTVKVVLSDDFNQRADLQREFIRKKWTEYGKQQAYKESLLDIENAKNK